MRHLLLAVGALKPDLQPVWAHYFSRYLEAYRDQSIAEQSFDLELDRRSARLAIPGAAIQTILVE